MDECKHPPARLYSWTAYDGTLCVGCCWCGKILQGGAHHPPSQPMDGAIEIDTRQTGIHLQVKILEPGSDHYIRTRQGKHVTVALAFPVIKR